MRKSILGLFALMMIFLFSCADDKTSTGKERDGMVDFSIKASIPQEIKTYASETGGASNVDKTMFSLRYIMEVYDGETLAYRGYQIVSDNFTGTDVTFNVRLLAKEYKFVFWADFVDKNNPNKDLYYQTCAALGTDQSTEAFKTDLAAGVGEGLKDIQMVPFADVPYKISTDARDAYFKIVPNVDLRTSDYMSLGTVKLQRPFGKYRLLATDAPKNYGFKQGDPLGNVTVDYAKAMGSSARIPYKFNAVIDEVDINNLVDVTNYTAPSSFEASTEVGGATKENVYVLAFDYIFVPADISGVAQTFPVAFAATVYAADNTTQVGYRDISSIPVQRNKLTTVIGNFFSNSSLLDIVVEDAFGDKTLQDANNISQDITDEYTLTIPDNTSAPELTYVFTGNIAPGAKITVTDEHPADDAVNYKGTVNIAFVNPTSATVVINTPQASVNFLGTVGTLDATTGDHTLVILKNSIVTTLNVDGGNAEIYGDVTTVNNNNVLNGSKVFWGVSSWDDIIAEMAKSGANDGIVFAKDITDNRNFYVEKEGYIIDGKGYAFTGAFTKDYYLATAAQNAIIINANNVTIKNLTVTNTAHNGILVNQITGAILEDLTLKDNAAAGVVVSGAEATIKGSYTSSGNGWGSINVGQGSGVTTNPKLTIDADATFDIEDATPIWGDFAGVDPAVPGANLNATGWYCSDQTIQDGVSVNCVWKIGSSTTNIITSVAPGDDLQAAINGADAGSTIALKSGGNYNIGKGLTLTTGRDVIIEGNGATLTAAAPYPISAPAPFGSQTRKPALYVNGGNLTLKNATLDVTDATGDKIPPDGIILESGTLTLDGVTFEKVLDTGGLNGMQYGFDIFQYGGTMSVKNCSFSQFNKGAIVVYLGRAEIEDSYFEGDVTDKTAQNGIQLGSTTVTGALGADAGPDGYIKNCTFKNFVYTPTPMATAIMNYSPNITVATDITGNSFTNCDTNIYDFYQP